MLKSDIRGLEASLTREKEFNNSSASNRISTEYLVNVIKKFFMTEPPDERVKCVQVLCTLLHIDSEESKDIVRVYCKIHKISLNANGIGSNGGGGIGSGALLQAYVSNNSHRPIPALIGWFSGGTSSHNTQNHGINS